MKPAIRSARAANVFDQLALRLRQVVRDEHANTGSAVEKFTVISVTPLILDELNGNLILEDGDPDFTVGSWLRQYMLNYSLVVGDVVQVARNGSTWHALDVVDPGGQASL